MSLPIEVRIAKRRVATVWGVGAGAPFVLLVAQSLIGHYGTSASEVWAWFLGGVAPTLGLIGAVLGAEAMQADTGTPRAVDGFFLNWSLGLSIVYLLCLWAILLAGPLRGLSEGLPELLRETGTWITPLQGLVTAALGVLFVRKK